MLSMWFKHETNLLAMIDLLKIMKEELDKAAYKIHGQNVKARLEVSLREGPWQRPQAMCFKGQGGRGRVQSEIFLMGNFRYPSLWEEILLACM